MVNVNTLSNLWLSLTIVKINQYWGPFHGGPVLLFPRNTVFPCPKSNFCFPVFPVPENCLCPPIALKLWAFFSCSSETNAFVPECQYLYRNAWKSSWTGCGIRLYRFLIIAFLCIWILIQVQALRSLSLLLLCRVSMQSVLDFQLFLLFKGK